MDLSIDRLIQRTEVLYQAIESSVPDEVVSPDARAFFAATHADIALEHGRSILHLTAVGNTNSALALARVQFDAVLRAVWVLYGATDSQIQRLAVSVNARDEKEPNNFPNLSEMIEQIRKRGPSGVGEMIEAYKDEMWRPTSSVVHSGIYSLHERYQQLSPNIKGNTLLNANGLSVMAAMTLEIASNGAVTPGAIQRIQYDFLDCCPPAIGEATEQGKV